MRKHLRYPNDKRMDQYIEMKKNLQKENAKQLNRNDFRFAMFHYLLMKKLMKYAKKMNKIYKIASSNKIKNIKIREIENCLETLYYFHNN
jgi:hypothetical protein